MNTNLPRVLRVAGVLGVAIVFALAFGIGVWRLAPWLHSWLWLVAVAYNTIVLIAMLLFVRRQGKGK